MSGYTSMHLATPKTSNVRTILLMRQLFGYEVGLSGYTMGVGAAVALMVQQCSKSTAAVSCASSMGNIPNSLLDDVALISPTGL